MLILRSGLVARELEEETGWIGVGGDEPGLARFVLSSFTGERKTVGEDEVWYSKSSSRRFGSSWVLCKGVASKESSSSSFDSSKDM
jgi:hypothetical protein